MTVKRRIAVVGASQNRRKYGNKCVRAYLEEGWEVFPIHPAVAEVEGCAAYPSIDELPESVDRIALYTPPSRTQQLLPVLPPETEVFFNPGTADAAILEEATRLGIDVHPACAIVAIGRRPSEFPES
jgi:predicted CoA-binding protein